MAQAFLLWARTLAIFAACFCLVRCEGNTGEESLPQSDERESEDRKEFNQGTVLFNNPKLLPQNSNDGKDWAQDFDRTQEAFNPNIMGGVNILQEALTLGDKLRDLSNADMGVLSMQTILDSLVYAEQKPDLEEQLRMLVEQVWTKLDRYLRVLKTNKLTVENYFRFHLRVPLTARQDCCTLTNNDLRYDAEYETYVSKQYSCDLVPQNVRFGSFNPGRNVTEVFQHNIQYIPSIKWQYFISTEGVHNEFPAHNFQNLPYTNCRNTQDQRHRKVLVSTFAPQRKNIVIMIDHGNSLSDNQLYTAKAIAKHILLSLSDNDKVSVIGLSATVSYPRVDRCLRQHLVPFTAEANMQFLRFIEQLQKQTTATDHSHGFAKAFNILYKSLVEDNKASSDDEKHQAMIVYISRGLLNSLIEAKRVMSTIASENELLRNSVIINTYAVVDDGKPPIFEKSFMQDIALQNFTKYMVSSQHPTQPPKGVFLVVNNTRDLANSVGNFYRSFNFSTPNQPLVTLPAKDEISTGLVVSVAWPCFYDGSLLGLVGLDIHAADLLEGVTYFNSPDRNTYAFLVDYRGYTIMHPDLKRPSTVDKQPMYTDISHFEDFPEFREIRDAILNTEEGIKKITVPRNKDNTTVSSQLFDLSPDIVVKYHWKKVRIKQMRVATPFIVVMKTVEDGFSRYREIVDVPPGKAENLVHHRLDLLPTGRTCMHLKQLATVDSSALFLAANSFSKPYEHLSQEETKKMVQVYLAYLNDNTGLITNPGFREPIRKDVAVVSKINSEWSRQFRYSSLKDFTVRRFVATPSGVFLMFPGTLLNKEYDPTKRMWYRRAAEYPGKVTLTAPYLDTGGAGYIVTISHTIYEGKQDALHHPFDRVAAVMGMDMTLGYFYKLIVEQIPVCERDHIRCFIMDDRGYLIAHKGLVEPNGRGPVEQQHITHKEPLVANDILNHIGFVKKKLCNSYNGRTIQRFYHFNTTLAHVLTNLVHGEHCSRYQVTAIRGTNAFFGMVNETCTMMRAFCPCSMIDRLCLNCHRMEQTECECPCECPLEMNYCTGDLLEEEDRNPSCRSYPEAPEEATVPAAAAEALPQCVHTRCADRRTKSACLGVMDCEWCVLEHDGKTPLGKPFCSSQRVCFAGVLGASTPYRDEIMAVLQEAEQLTFRSTPVGPVAGGIMGCFLVLVLAVYCYRHHVHRNSHQYISSLPEQPAIRMSHFDGKPDDDEISEEPAPSGHTNIVLATFDNPASISPYRVNTSYRRPTGGESDHGYSTMTPHEDSEQASTTCLEPLIMGRDRYRPSSTNSSVISKPGALPPPPGGASRRSRSPTPPQTQLLLTGHLSPSSASPRTATIPEGASLPPPGQTVLPADTGTVVDSPHAVIANVQVHMVDSH